MNTHGTYAQCSEADFGPCVHCFTRHCALAGCDAPQRPDPALFDESLVCDSDRQPGDGSRWGATRVSPFERRRRAGLLPVTDITGHTGR